MATRVVFSMDALPRYAREVEGNEGQDGVGRRTLDQETARMGGVFHRSRFWIRGTEYLYLGPGVPGNRPPGFMLLGTGNKNTKSGGVPGTGRTNTDLACYVGTHRHKGSKHAFALIAEIPAI